MTKPTHWSDALRRLLGRPPSDHGAILDALRRDERPLRAAYAPQAKHTVAMARDRLADAADHGRLLWADFDAYRDSVFRQQRHTRQANCRLLSETVSDTAERVWRIDGLDFAAIHVRRRGGRVVEVAFVPQTAARGAGSVVVGLSGVKVPAMNG